LRAAAKSLITSKNVVDSDANVQKIIEAYGSTVADLKNDVDNFVAQGTSADIFTTANTTEEKFRWERSSNLLGYDNFDVS
jgi:hypothetical protein